MYNISAERRDDQAAFNEVVKNTAKYNIPGLTTKELPADKFPCGREF
eukprot:UN09204